MEYKINFIRNSFKRFWEQHRSELLEAVDRCGTAGDLILRQDVVDFETNLAKYVGTKHAVAVGSGTDALFLACKALGIGPGDEVITVAHTFIASIQGVVHCGATPVLIDVGENELMDASLIEAAITPKTRAIIPVHFHGKVCDMDVIATVAKKYNLFIIEDACQALGSSYFGHCGKAQCKNGEMSMTTVISYPDGKENSNTSTWKCPDCDENGKRWRKAGSFGDIGCFSFNTPKLMGGWGDGGAITTNNKALAHKITLLRNHYNMAQTSVNMPDFPTPEVVHWGFKSRMDNMNAAMLNVKWKYYDELLARRKEIADLYCEGLKGLPITLPSYKEGDVIQEFIIRVPEEINPLLTRQAFKDHMDKKGIELLIRETTPNHKVKLLGLDHFSLPVTEGISRDAVRLPAYPELTNEEITEIITAIKEFYGLC